MDFFDLNASLVIIAVLCMIVLYRFFFHKKSTEEQALEKEYQEVLKLDKYKVKGQW